MKMKPLGRTGLSVSEICLGTMTFGEQNTEAEGHAQMDYALERGINFFDTAELYSIPPRPETAGATERIIGTWLAKGGRRDKVILATKIVGRTAMDWFREGKEPGRITPAQIDYAVEGSLRRLQTDHIDLYQMHWPDRAIQVFGGWGYRHYGPDYTPFEVILEALGRHVEKGNIGHVGVSNETAYGVMRFVQAAEAKGLPRIASIQNAYNLVNRTFEYGLAEACVEEAVSLLAYSPLGQGYLTGKYQAGALPAGSRKALFQRLGRYEGPGADGAIQSYLDLAADRGLSPSALAIAFCVSRPFMTSTIIGATSMAQLAADIDAAQTPWSDDLEKAVNALHARCPNPCP